MCGAKVLTARVITSRFRERSGELARQRNRERNSHHKEQHWLGVVRDRQHCSGTAASAHSAQFGRTIKYNTSGAVLACPSVYVNYIAIDNTRSETADDLAVVTCCHHQ